MSKMIPITMIVYMLLGASAFGADHPSSNRMLSGTLTIDETIRLTKSRHIPSSIMNKQARPEFVKILKDTGQIQYWPNVIVGMGEIGDQSDVSLVMGSLSSVHGKIDRNMSKLPTNVIACMSRMTSRGIKPARDEIIKMLVPDYWRKYDFILESIADYYVDQNTYLACNAMSLYSLSNDPDCIINIKAAVEKVTNEKSRKLLESRIPDCVENYNINLKAIASGNPQKYIEENYFTAKKTSAENAIEGENKIYNARRRNIFKILDDKAYFIIDSVVAEDKISILKCAKQSLDEKIKPWIYKPYDSKIRNEFLRYISGDAVPLNIQSSDDMEAWLANKPKVLNALGELHLVATVLFQKDLDLEHARILSYSMDKIDQAKAEEIRKDPKAKADMIIVIIPVKNGEDLKTKFPKYFKKSGPFGPLVTLDENGTPLIHVIYHRDMNKWFWNPPGW